MSCEGALLVVDTSRGVETQTVANLYLAPDPPANSPIAPAYHQQ